MPNACPTMGCLSTTALVFVVLALGASASQGGPKPSEQREVIPEHLFFSQEEVGYAAPPAPSRPQKPILKDPIPSQHIFEGQKAVDDIFEDVPLQQAQRPQRIPLEKKVPIPNEAIPLQEEVRPSQHLPVEQKEVECPFHPPKDHGFSPQEQKEKMTTPQMINEHPGPEFSHPNKPHHCQQDSHSRGWSHKLDGFPPGRPSPDNINRICFPERKHVVYGPWNLPQTGYSHLSRQGNALNFLETGYTDCCRLKTNQLDCATAVWADALFRFCEAEFSVKTRAYSCCSHQGEARLSCFQEHTSLPDYQPLPGPCPTHTPRPSSGLELSFPPGVPTRGNVRNICRLRRFRSLPRGLLSMDNIQPQLRALMQLEGKFRRCCHQGDNHTCARQAWEDVLDSYCEEEMAIKTHHHTCCHRSPLSARDACFARHAPYPNYDRDILTIDLSRITPDTMNQLCGHRKVLTKHKQIPGLIRNMTARCCELPPPERGFCAEEEKSAFIEDLCGSRRDTWRDTDFCCDETPGYGQTSCFNAYYLRNVALVAGVAQKPKDQPGTGTTELPPASPTPEHKGK
ncbi:extracellular matrix protein 1-like isoform X2 [Vombatus ursinus]|uniref:extracellular matrix protein 1-like isoform X2 n=1 Tax=Vombatus ursinus TaxID=29139 RepID=UPI000FFD9A56|nr:extracellular matrix protein 1-like isoform X2 [Vombatus ursinus]XP_027717968.1 extracellular matrix protein 1-like isoform X2 [Vombatus ursinus]